MAIRPRTRKRIQAVRRASDGSAFEKCEECGVTIAIALFDMHECGEKKIQVKRFKYINSGKIDNNTKSIGSFEDEPRSPFIFFLEDFKENYDVSYVEASGICFNVWKKMSQEEQKPFRDLAMEIDFAHNIRLNEEAKLIYKVNDEADSKDVAKLDKSCNMIHQEEEEDYDSSDHFEHECWYY
ncbi:unnamed protein product [Cochlearia groenlandica]